MNTHRQASRSTRRTRAGITLIESVVSLSVISVLMLGLSSSVMLAVKALPTDTELGAADREVQEICNQLRDDIAASTAVTYQVSGNTTRLNLEMISTNITGAHTHIGWEFIGDADIIRRRVDARAYEIISTTMSDYTISIESDASQISYIHAQFQYDSSVQRVFELFIQTPYKPELK